MEIKNRNSLWRSGLSVINQFSILTSHFPILNSQFSLLTMPHANHVRWRLRGSLPVQVDLSLPHNLIHLQAVDDAGGGITVQVTAQSPLLWRSKPSLSPTWNKFPPVTPAICLPIWIAPTFAGSSLHTASAASCPNVWTS